MKICRIILLGGAIILFSQLRPALAHAALVRAEPAPDAILDHAPAEIRTWFSSPLIAGSRLKVFDSQFRAAAVGPTVIDSADPTLMHAPIESPESLQPGRYTVNWEATADDGHVSLGSYEFVVREGTAALVWPLVGGIVLLVSVGIFAFMMRRSALRRSSERPPAASS